MMLLPELENDEFIFVAPLTWKACIFMDSFECGGAGAKWCIGYEKTDEYFEQYLDNGSLFILAFRKHAVSQDEMKYMITLDMLISGDNDMYANRDSVVAWRQNDSVSETIPNESYKQMFGWSHQEMLDVFEKAILSWDGNAYTGENDERRIQRFVKNGININSIKHFDPKIIRRMIDEYGEISLSSGEELIPVLKLDEILKYIVDNCYNESHFGVIIKGGHFRDVHIENIPKLPDGQDAVDSIGFGVYVYPVENLYISEYADENVMIWFTSSGQLVHAYVDGSTVNKFKYAG